MECVPTNWDSEWVQDLCLSMKRVLAVALLYDKNKVEVMGGWISERFNYGWFVGDIGLEAVDEYVPRSLVLSKIKPSSDFLEVCEVGGYLSGQRWIGQMRSIRLSDKVQHVSIISDIAADVHGFRWWRRNRGVGSIGSIRCC